MAGPGGALCVSSEAPFVIPFEPDGRTAAAAAVVEHGPFHTRKAMKFSAPQPTIGL